MKTILVLFMLLLSCSLFGQIALPDQAIMYRGFDLRVQIPDRMFTSLECDDCEIKNLQNGDYIISTTTSKSDVLLTVVNKRGKVKDSLRVQVRDIPDPEIFFGQYSNGDSLDTVPDFLKVAFPNHIPLTINFLISGGFYSFEGIQEDVLFSRNIPDTFFEQVKDLPKGTRIIISLEILGPNRIKRTVTALFYR